MLSNINVRYNLYCPVFCVVISKKFETIKSCDINTLGITSVARVNK